jgi:hypothetical protein
MSIAFNRWKLTAQDLKQEALLKSQQQLQLEQQVNVALIEKLGFPFVLLDAT